MRSHPIILFDGVCNFCRAWVRFVIRRDKEARFRFAPLQSPAGRQLLARHGLRIEEIDSVVLIEDEAVFTRSDAALRIASALPGGWRLLGVFRALPRAGRDWVYGIIARNRYRWFGRTEACMVPSEAVRKRFIG